MTVSSPELRLNPISIIVEIQLILAPFLKLRRLTLFPSRVTAAASWDQLRSNFDSGRAAAYI